MTRNDALRAARMQRHWTQSTLAVQLNATRTTVGRWEQGLASPGLYFREQLCRIFGMTEAQLGLDERTSGLVQSQIWLVPEERNLFFTGRETELEGLHQAFCGSAGRGATRVHVVSGLAGMGKSQVALEYAYRFRQHYAAIAWINAETPETLRTDLRKLAHALHLVPVQEQEETRILQALQVWMQVANDWLLILDNVEELALASRLLPVQAPGGCVLITTRAQASGRFRRLNLDGMSNEESVLLILHRAKLLPLHLDLTQVAVAEYTCASQLCQEFGHLPLALDQAGAYIEETGCSVSGYLERFKSRRSALLAWHDHQSGSYPWSVNTMLLMAREKVLRQSALAYDLLCMCLFFHPDTIPEQLITQNTGHLGAPTRAATVDLLSLDQAFAVLHASALLRRDPETHLLSIHRLVQTVLADQLEDAERATLIIRSLRALQALFPANPRHAVLLWPLCEQLLPHILACLEHITTFAWEDQQEQATAMATCATLLLKVVEYQLELARYQEAETLLQRALDLAQQTHDSTGMVARTTALYSLAILYEKLGKYNEAEALLLRVLLICREKPDEGYTQIHQVLHSLALLRGRQGKYAEASQFAQQALHGYRQARSDENPEMAEVFHTLAQLALWTSDYPLVLSWGRRALEILEKTLGSEHPRVAGVVHTLALASWEQGQYQEAGELFQRASGLWEQTLGPEHPFAGYPVYNQALLYKVQGEYEQAEKLFLRVLRLWEQSFGLEHPQSGEPLRHLAEVYLLQQHYGAAQAMAQRALDLYQSSLGPECPQLIVPLSILAAIEVEQGHYEQASTLYQAAYLRCKQSLDQEHPHLARVLHGQGRLFLKQKQYAQAQTLFQQALAIRVRKLGALHPDTQLTDRLLQDVLALSGTDTQLPERESLVSGALKEY